MHWRLIVVGSPVVSAYRNGAREHDFRTGPSDDPADFGLVPPAPLVASDSVVLNSYAGVTHDVLEVSGQRFDRLRLVGGVSGTPAPCWVSLDTLQVDWVGGPLPVDTGDTGGGVSDTDVAVDTDDRQPSIDTDPVPQGDTDVNTVNTDTDPFANGTVFIEQRCGCDTSSQAPWLPAVLGLIALRRRRAALVEVR